ncbi:serine-type endopeptidase activity protein [[Candida] boidinii]|nr:serine-type endopeptidase activity protein [[Candida] boidinii]
MKLSSSVCASILISLGVANALVIPQFETESVPDAFILKQDSKEAYEARKVELNRDVTKKTSSSSKVSAPGIMVGGVQLLAESEANALVTSPVASKNLIPHSYIIVFKDQVSKDQINFHQEWANEVQSQSFLKLTMEDDFVSTIKSQGLKTHGGILDMFHIDGLFSGYHGYFTEEAIQLINRHPDVAFVELDSRVFINEAKTQVGAPWGLARISHRDSLSLSDYNRYVYDEVAGKGVTAYVIDTGVSVTHQEFDGRAKWGKTIPTDDSDVDGNGHGTHCAGTIGSKDYGISKNAEIVAVKVLKTNGSGTMSDVIKGVEFAANAHIKALKESKPGFKGSTANMSLGGGKSPGLDLAVNAAVKAGLHFAVAAGNDNADACNYSPAAAEKAVTVGASTLSDARAYFSNFGKCVDIFAPGLNILSTYIGSDSATAVLSGTSMASPHVCGLLTYFLSLQPESESLFSTAAITPDQLKKNIIDFATPNILKDIDSETPNLLIYNGAGKNLSEFWGESISSSSSNEKELDLNEKIEQFAETEKKFEDAVNDILINIKDTLKDTILNL